MRFSFGKKITKSVCFAWIQNTVSAIDNAFGISPSIDQDKDGKDKTPLIWEGSFCDPKIPTFHPPKAGLVDLCCKEPTEGIHLVLSWIKDAQQANHLCAFLDLGDGFDKKAWSAMGIDLDFLLFCQPHSMWQMFDILDAMLQMTPKPKLMVVHLMDDLYLDPVSTENPTESTLESRLSHLRRRAYENSCTIVFVQSRSGEKNVLKKILTFYAETRIQLT